MAETKTKANVVKPIVVTNVNPGMSGWLPALPKRVQLSLWDAADPVVDTGRFGFPIARYRLFSHGTQAYNEPVHLGARDGDPGGQTFYHDYGVDLAGYEGAFLVCRAH